MVKNPKIEEGYLTYECTGKGCESPDGKHSIPVEELIAHVASIAEELLYEGDPRGPNVYIVACMFKYIATGDSDISDLGDDPKFSDQVKEVVDQLFVYYDKIHSILNKTNDPLSKTNDPFLSLTTKTNKNDLN